MSEISAGNMIQLDTHFQFWTDFYFTAPQDAIVKTLVRNGVDTYMYVQNTTVQALKYVVNVHYLIR